MSGLFQEIGLELWVAHGGIVSFHGFRYSCSTIFFPKIWPVCAPQSHSNPQDQ
jgi:hypothetical protein